MAGRGERKPGGGDVAGTARRVLPAMLSAHPAAELLAAAAQRLAQDIDESREVRDRVAATRALIDLVHELDASPPPPGSPPPGEGIPSSEGEGAADDDRGNPFGIPDVSPHVGYTPPT